MISQEGCVNKSAIFGAGHCGISFFFTKKDIAENVIAFVDNDETKQGMSILGVPIISPDSLDEYDINTFYVSVTGHEEEVKKQLMDLGVEEERISYLPSDIFMDLEIRKERERLTKHDYEEKFIIYKELYENEKEEYMRKFELLKEKYKDIRIYRFDVDVIGEMMARYFYIYEEENEDSILKVYFPYLDFADRICNKKLIDLLRTQIYIPKADEVDFWDWVYRNHKDEIDISHEADFNHRDFPSFRKKLYDHEFELPCSERINENLKEIGIDGEYFCFAARASAYYHSSGCDDTPNIYRNFSFSDYRDTISYLNDNGYKSVRMGSHVEDIDHIEGLIDYAGKYYDEELDLYISSKCKGFIFPDSGINTFAMMFSAPMLVVNISPLLCGSGGFRYTDVDIFIPQKYYNENTGKYLSFLEMYKFEKKYWIGIEEAKKDGIKTIHNSSEEILESTKELIGRIEGTWVDTEIDISNYEKYKKFYNIMVNTKRPAWRNVGCIPWRPSAVYLRNNGYLLEGL